MKLSEFTLILKRMRKLGYPVDEMTVRDAQEMANKFGR